MLSYNSKKLLYFLCGFAKFMLEGMEWDMALTSKIMICDPGFNEEDIRASIEDAAQGHVKWIYDCILARWDEHKGLRLGQEERRRLRAAALRHYRSYVKTVVARMEGVSEE